MANAPLTPAVFHILLALADGPLHGYAIMQAVESHRRRRDGPGHDLRNARAAGKRGHGEGGGRLRADDRRRLFALQPAGRRRCAKRRGGCRDWSRWCRPGDSCRASRRWPAHRFSRAAYRLLLRAYPREFRERFGDDLQADFVEMLDARGRGARLAPRVCRSAVRRSADCRRRDGRAWTDRAHRRPHQSRRRILDALAPLRSPAGACARW